MLNIDPLVNQELLNPLDFTCFKCGLALIPNTHTTKCPQTVILYDELCNETVVTNFATKRPCKKDPQPLMAKLQQKTTTPITHHMILKNLVSGVLEKHFDAMWKTRCT